MRQHTENKNGSVVIEFGLIISLLLVPLLAGIWDTARLIDMNQVLTRAAREGVVMASRGDDPISTVLSYVESEGYVISDLTVTVNHGPIDPDFGQEVSVTLHYDFFESMVYPWHDIMPNGMTAVAYAKME